MARDIPSLLAEIQRRRDWVHVWERGRCCVSFAFACVEAQTGVDHLADIAPWTSFAEAKAVARALGGLGKAVSDRLPAIAPAMAQRGDIAGVLDLAFGVRLMVVEGATLVGPGKSGAVRIPRSAMKRAWSAVR